MATPASDPALVASPRLTSTSARSSPLIPPPPAPAPSAASSSLTSASPTAAARRPSVHLARSNSDRSHQPTSPRGFIATAVATYELRQGSDGEGEEEGYGQRGSRFSFNVDEDDVELLSDEEEATTLLNSASAAGTSSASSSPTKASSSTSGTGTAATHHARSGSGSIGTGAGGRTARREALRKHPKEGIDSEWRSRGAGLLAGIANMSNSILGAGIIALPYALRESGLFTGTILIIILGLATDWTIRLILLTSKMSGRTTYIDIMDSCFGPAGRLAVSICQFTFALGGMIAFSIILGDTIPHVLQAIIPASTNALVNFLTSRPFIVVVLTMGVSYPLSLHRDIEKLSHASALALVSMVVIIVSVAIRGPQIDMSLKGDQTDRWTFMNPGVFEAIGVISFAFVCHHNSLLIYGSLSIPTLDRFARVTHISTALSVLACLAMSMSGYLVFTSSTQGNILNNFAGDDTLINVARACLGANMFATLPLEAFVCREVLESYFWSGKEFSARRHFIITTCLVVSAMSVSLITCDLGLVLELAGGTSATGLAYIFPAACYLRLSAKKRDATRVAAWICCCFGVIVMVLSTIFSISRALSGSKPHKTC